MQQLGPFTAKSERDNIAITRVHGKHSKISLSPSELSTVSRLIDTALSYCSNKTLPPKIQWGQFEVMFSETGEHVLTRIGEDSGLAFKEDEGDPLIALFGVSLDSYVDSLKLTGGPRKGVSTVSLPDPLIIGR